MTNYELTDATIVRETEKAFQFDLTIDTACGRKGFKQWFPKSQIEVTDDGKFIAPAWLIAKKNEDIQAFFVETRGGRNGYYAGFYGIALSKVN